jgi:hypothetical protein
MTFTVVRAVRGGDIDPTAPPRGERLQENLQRALCIPPAAMDLPFAEQIIRLDFVSTDFARTVPGRLAEASRSEA